MLQTEYPFNLPMGYVDPEGTLHRDGTMRLATAFDLHRPHLGLAFLEPREEPWTTSTRS